MRKKIKEFQDLIRSNGKKGSLIEKPLSLETLMPSTAQKKIISLTYNNNTPENIRYENSIF